MKRLAIILGFIVLQITTALTVGYFVLNVQYQNQGNSYSVNDSALQHTTQLNDNNKSDSVDTSNTIQNGRECTQEKENGFVFHLEGDLDHGFDSEKIDGNASLENKESVENETANTKTETQKGHIDQQQQSPQPSHQQPVQQQQSSQKQPSSNQQQTLPSQQSQSSYQQQSSQQQPVNLSEIKLKSNHPQIERLDTVSRHITAVSGTTVSDFVNQIEPIDTDKVYSYEVRDWLGEKKLQENLSMLTNGDKLIVEGENACLEYTIEVPGVLPYWDNEKYNSILKTVKDNIPQFKPDIYRITDAKYSHLIGDLSGVEDFTDVFRAAIAECTANGGGTVLVPARSQSYYTGAIVLENNVKLNIETGATIDFIAITAANGSAYFPRVCTNFEGTDFYGFANPVYAGFKENIAITGGGTITYSNIGFWDGDVDSTIKRWNAEKTPLAFRDAYQLGQRIQPSLVEIYGCKNVILSDISVDNASVRLMDIAMSENVLVRGVTFKSDGSNSDGNSSAGCIPISSKNVVIENNFFSNKGDNIALKVSRADNGNVRNRPTEDIIIRKNEFNQGFGININGEGNGVVKGIFVESNWWNGSNSVSGSDNLLHHVLRIKIPNTGYTLFENIFFRNCAIGAIHESFIDLEHAREAENDVKTEESGDIPSRELPIRNIAFSNMFSVANSADGKIDSLFSQFFFQTKTSPVQPIQNCYMKDMNLSSSGVTPDYMQTIINSVKNLNLENIKINNTVYNTESETD